MSGTVINDSTVQYLHHKRSDTRNAELKLKDKELFGVLQTGPTLLYFHKANTKNQTNKQKKKYWNRMLLVINTGNVSLQTRHRKTKKPASVHDPPEQYYSNCILSLGRGRNREKGGRGRGRREDRRKSWGWLWRDRGASPTDEPLQNFKMY